METVTENIGGSSAVSEKKSRKTLPPVDAASVSAAEVNEDAAKPLLADTATVAPPPAADPSLEISALQAQLCKATQTARVGLGVAAIALVFALSSPWWVPRVIDNDSGTRQSVALAAAQVHVLANHDAPFARELAVVTRALPTDKATRDVVATIEPLAKAGVPTVASLKDSFKGTADRVLVGQVVNKNDESWVNWSLHKMATMIRIDTLTSTVATPPADVKLVHDAETALDNDDLAQAVEHLSKLEGNSATEVEGWLTDARNRVALDKAVDRLARLAESRSNTVAWLR